MGVVSSRIPSFCLFISIPANFGSSEDLGGCTVCHLATETDTNSFGCDLFELMVQNIVSTPTPRGNFVGALGQCKWPIVYLSGQRTLARVMRVHISACTYTFSHTCTHGDSQLSSYLLSHGGHNGQC